MPLFPFPVPQRSPAAPAHPSGRGACRSGLRTASHPGFSESPEPLRRSWWGQDQREREGGGRSSDKPYHAVPEESQPWVSAKIPVPKLVMGPTEPSALRDIGSSHEGP